MKLVSHICRRYISYLQDKYFMSETFHSSAETNFIEKDQVVRLGLFHGGPEEIRTLDPHNANVMRSQLRYRPMCSVQTLLLYYNTKFKKVKCYHKYFLPDIVNFYFFAQLTPRTYSARTAYQPEPLNIVLYNPAPFLCFPVRMTSPCRLSYPKNSPRAYLIL